MFWFYKTQNIVDFTHNSIILNRSLLFKFLLSFKYLLSAKCTVIYCNTHYMELTSRYVGPGRRCMWCDAVRVWWSVTLKSFSIIYKYFDEYLDVRNRYVYFVSFYVMKVLCSTYYCKINACRRCGMKFRCLEGTLPKHLKVF